MAAVPRDDCTENVGRIRRCRKKTALASRQIVHDHHSRTHKSETSSVCAGKAQAGTPAQALANADLATERSQPSCVAHVIAADT